MSEQITGTDNLSCITSTTEEDPKLEKLDLVRSLKLRYLEFLSHNLAVHLKEKQFCDVKLKIGEKIFECHRVILVSNSKLFESLFKEEFVVVAAEQEIKCLSNEYVDEKSFSKLLNAMYGEPLEFNEDWIPLFRTSTFLQLTHFIDQCESYILQNLEKIDLSEIIVLPELKITEALYTAIKKYICHNFPQYYSRLAAISLDILEDLLSDPELFVSNIKQLFDLGKKWINHDLANRKQHLQSVASLLKPFHTSDEQSLKIIVSEMGKFLQDEYAVGICLKTLLESSNNHEDNEDEKLKLGISGSLFFIQPNDESEVLFGTFENDSWVFLNEIQVPMSTALLTTYDSAVVDDTLYFTAVRKQLEDGKALSTRPSCPTFHRWGKKTQEWIELMPPRLMPQCLIPCNSTLYLYEHSCDNYQFSFYEPMLNRWLKAPAVNYPRTCAGIASDDKIIYVVGGEPLRKISEGTPRNIIEMYDSRCGRWSRVVMSLGENEIGNYSYHRKVCSSENTLFVLDGKKLMRIDFRNRSLIGVNDLEEDFSVDCDWYLTLNNPGELWIVNVTESVDIKIFGTDGEKKSSLRNPNVFVEPISVQW